MVYVLRKMYKMLKTIDGDNPGDLTERVPDAAEQVGIDTSGVRKLMESTIGEKVRDLPTVQGSSILGRGKMLY